MKCGVLPVTLYLLAPAVLVGSLFIGPSQSATPLDLWRLLTQTGSQAQSDLARTILLDVRLPRVLLTFIVGAALAASGSALQAVFRNPLVSPYVLGLSSGAAFGAALALALPLLPVTPCAFLFGLLAVAASYLMARRNRSISIVSLILAGMVVNGIFTALLTVVQYLSDPFRLQSIVHWTMGNLHTASWASLRAILLPAGLGAGVLLLMAWRMNVLALGDEEAAAVGVHPEREKIIVVLAATLASSAVVAVAGIIGLYGLLIPQMVRMIAGVDNRQALPLNLAFGGWFLVLIDDLSRSLGGQEIPIGVFTMVISAPVFVYLMRKNHIGWEQ
jgi:iron complex transport system permease protein